MLAGWERDEGPTLWDPCILHIVIVSKVHYFDSKHKLRVRDGSFSLGQLLLAWHAWRQLTLFVS